MSVDHEEGQALPVVDLFAGPGGLGEGFSACLEPTGRPCFDVRLSVEKDLHAHRTLELRAFFREFRAETVPEEYYQYLRGEISRSDLFTRYPTQVTQALNRTWRVELGSESCPAATVDERIRQTVGDAASWVLVGGPPCQAYSTIGRSRMRGADPEGFEKDPRHYLYKEFLRILAIHRPPVFVLENVSGILSARVNGENIFSSIIDDLLAVGELEDADCEPAKEPQMNGLYHLFPLGQDPQWFISNGRARHYIVESEKYGVPQRRHRVILLGVRRDLDVVPRQLAKCESAPCTGDVIDDLPKLRSGLSREENSGGRWVDAIRSITDSCWLNAPDFDEELRSRILQATQSLCADLTTGGDFVRCRPGPAFESAWYVDDRLGGACNHSTKMHMREDLHRYLFASCFAHLHGRSPTLAHFPDGLLPNHRNVRQSTDSGTQYFADRFRVQVRDRPSTTITAHFAKDGHSSIHPDPRQCRSLTVREAARLQTFPDNYFFEGPLGSQYRQVGNAVPPLLARSIARSVYDVLTQASEDAHRPQRLITT